MVKTSSSQKADQATENRKLRNRLSQKAYRARQCMRIKELEERLDGYPQGENARIEELENQNQQLRDQLLSCHKKLESLSLSMKALADSAATSLGLESGSGACKAPTTYRDPDNPPNEESMHPLETIGDDEDFRDDLIQQDVAQGPVTEPFAQQSDDHYVDLGGPSASDSAESIKLPRSQELAFWSGNSTPKSYSFENLFKDGSSPSASFFGKNPLFTYQSMNPISRQPLPSYADMGGTSYANAISKAPLLIRGPHGDLHKSNSLFSDHIAVVEHFLKQKWAGPRSLSKHGEEGLANSVSFMLSVFVCMSWSVMTSWHTYTRSHLPLRRLHIWRLNPTVEAYMNLDSWYRPTQIQLTVPHPLIIDWMPWPAMRDKLIIHHSANPRLDDVVCDIGNNYVMECDLSKLVANIRPMQGLIGVFDLVRSIAPTATSDPVQEYTWSDQFDPNFSDDSLSPTGSIEDIDGAVDAVCSLPAPNVDALFNSKAFALQAFNALGCARGACHFKLDPEFFRNHPELYDPTSNLMANGIMRLRPQHHRSIVPPRLLDSSTLGRYRELSTWTFDPSFFHSDAATVE